MQGIGGGSHLKLADMGACLPYSAAARALVAQSRDIIKNLRDGDWRAEAGVSIAPVLAGSSSASAAAAGGGVDGTGEEGCPDGDDEAEDWRVEGTAEYLAPEVRAGESLPTVASDAYALGVTLFQVLAGRLPDADAMWSGAAAAGGAPAAHHVRFAEAAPPQADSGFPPGFPPLAADLIRGMLHPDPAQRTGGGDRGLAEVAEHAWFAPLLQRPGRSVAAALGTLHREPSPSALPGLAAPGDPAWSRRHYSSMWAPLPRAYTSFLATTGGGAGGGGAATAGEGGGGTAAGEPQRITLSACVLADVLPPLPPVAPVA